METGEKIRAERLRQGLSIRRFAKVIGVNEKTVAGIEKGTVDTYPHTLAQIEDALGWDKGSLTGRSA